MAAEERQTRLRRRLAEEYGMDEADLLLDRPPGGWDDLVTKEWLHLELGAFEARMDARFAVIDGRFAEMDARFAVIDGRFAALDARFAAIDARFAAIDARLLATDERLGSFERGFRSLESRLDDLAKDLRSQTWRLVSVLVAAMAVAISVNRF